jgi:pheromone shutdown protein TraB
LLLKQSDPEKYQESSRDQPVIYRLLARFQDGLADEYGVQAGEEMLTTINYAQSHQLPLAFIDMNAQALFSRMLKQMSFREKLRVMFSGFAGLFVSKKRVEKELETIEDNFDAYIEQVGVKFPTIKRVLIDERNAYMVQQLVLASEKYENIIAVIGDGHIPGLSKLFEKKELDFETIRLKEIRDVKTDESGTSSASFTVENKPI